MASFSKRTPLLILVAATVVPASGKPLDWSGFMAAERAQEQVYCRHRRRSKGWLLRPTADAAPCASEEEIRRKAAEIVRNCELLEKIWNRPIRGEDLQSEIDRMVRDTAAPGTFQELLEALNNDPRLVAETVARRTLAERLVHEYYAKDVAIHAPEREAALTLRSRLVTSDDWRKTAAAAAARYVRTTMRLAGGQGEAERGSLPLVRSGAREIELSPEAWRRELKRLPGCVGWVSRLQETNHGYLVTRLLEGDPLNAATNRVVVERVIVRKRPYEEWAETVAPTLPPAESALPEILRPSLSYPFRLGRRARQAGCQDSWSAPTTVGAPPGRYYFSAVWTGAEMIVFGGYDIAVALNSGGRYDPATDSWSPTSTVGAPSARGMHDAVWTGSEMIVWGGFDGFQSFGTGGRYDPATDTWSPMSATGAPSPRSFLRPEGVWTGAVMVVFGGQDAGGGNPNTGGRYNPATDTWTPTTTVGAPAGRQGHATVFTGNEMVVFGGGNASTDFDTGGRYDPVADAWTATTTTGAPTPRYLPSAVWDGTEMIVWGGYNASQPFATGGSYNPVTDAWKPLSTVSAPAGRSGHIAVWSNGEMIVWGGDDWTSYTATGGRYDPATDTWSATTMTGAPAARALAIGVDTGETIVLWGGQTSGTPFATGGIYLNAMILSVGLPIALQGLPYSASVTVTGGVPAYSFAVTAGALPSGLSLGASTGTISGTPTSAGSFPLTITATDSLGCTGRQDYLLVVNPASDFIVGKGHGQVNDNTVSLFSRLGTPVGSFQAYGGGGFGTNAASGNIDGGTYAEILTGPGPGPIYGPQVRAFDRLMAPLAKVNFYAYGTLRYGVNATSCDLDLDGFGEILSGAGPGDVFGPHVRGFNFDGGKLAAIPRISFFAYKTLKWGVHVEGGDLDGDFYHEILTAPGPGQIFGAQIRGFNDDGSGISPIGKINFNAYQTYKYGANVAGGDVDADGYAEIVTAPGAGAANPAEFRAFNFDGASIAAIAGLGGTPLTTLYGGRVGTGDLLGDGGEDLVEASGPDPSAPADVLAFSWDGASTSALPGTPFTAFTSLYGVNLATGTLGY